MHESDVNQAVGNPTVLSPVDYFMAYLSDEILESLTVETQKRYMAVKGRPFMFTTDIMTKFVGITFMTSICKFPRL